MKKVAIIGAAIALLALAGTAAAGLLHFAFRKEEDG